jgi:hypothetical protein
VGRYRERLSFGPGGKGKADIWVPEREGEQHNLILTQFYDSLIPNHGIINSSRFAAVGTGSTAPDPSQRGLVSEVARSNTVPSGESNAGEYVSPGVYNIRRVYEFTEAQVGGRNLTEWGFSPVSTAGGDLMTRELFRDGSGNPVVLTLASDQRLRLIYRYGVTLSPATAQPVTVNIGGEGPGDRTAQFTLTGRLGYTTSYAGIYVSSGQIMGDMFLLENFVRGTYVIGLGRVFATPNAAPLTYLHSVDNIGSATTPFLDLSFESPLGRSRRASVLVGASDWLTTIRSVCIAGGRSGAEHTPTINLVFDSGQQFTKDNQHKLFVGYWQITWGP